MFLMHKAHSLPNTQNILAAVPLPITLHNEADNEHVNMNHNTPLQVPKDKRSSSSEENEDKTVVKKGVVLSLLDIKSATDKHAECPSSSANSPHFLSCISDDCTPVDNAGVKESPLLTPTVCITHVDENNEETTIEPSVDFNIEYDSQHPLQGRQSVSLENLEYIKTEETHYTKHESAEPPVSPTGNGSVISNTNETVSRCSIVEFTNQAHNSSVCIQSPVSDSLRDTELLFSKEKALRTRNLPQILPLPESNVRSKSDPELVGLNKALCNFGSIEHLDVSSKTHHRKRAKTVSCYRSRRNTSHNCAKYDEFCSRRELQVPDSEQTSRGSIYSFFKKSKEYLSNSKSSIAETKDENT